MNMEDGFTTIPQPGAPIGIIPIGRPKNKTGRFILPQQSGSDFLLNDSCGAMSSPPTLSCISEGKKRPREDESSSGPFTSLIGSTLQTTIAELEKSDDIVLGSHLVSLSERILVKDCTPYHNEADFESTKDISPCEPEKLLVTPDVCKCLNASTGSTAGQSSPITVTPKATCIGDVVTLRTYCGRMQQLTRREEVMELMTFYGSQCRDVESTCQPVDADKVALSSSLSHLTGKVGLGTDYSPSYLLRKRIDRELSRSRNACVIRRLIESIVRSSVGVGRVNDDTYVSVLPGQVISNKDVLECEIDESLFFVLLQQTLQLTSDDVRTVVTSAFKEARLSDSATSCTIGDGGICSFFLNDSDESHTFNIEKVVEILLSERTKCRDGGKGRYSTNSFSTSGLFPALVFECLSCTDGAHQGDEIGGSYKYREPLLPNTRHLKHFFNDPLPCSWEIGNLEDNLKEKYGMDTGGTQSRVCSVGAEEKVESCSVLSNSRKQCADNSSTHKLREEVRGKVALSHSYLVSHVPHIKGDTRIPTAGSHCVHRYSFSCARRLFQCYHDLFAKSTPELLSLLTGVTKEAVMNNRGNVTFSTASRQICRNIICSVAEMLSKVVSHRIALGAAVISDRFQIPFISERRPQSFSSPTKENGVNLHKSSLMEPEKEGSNLYEIQKVLQVTNHRQSGSTQMLVSYGATTSMEVATDLSANIIMPRGVTDVKPGDDVSLEYYYRRHRITSRHYLRLRSLFLRNYSRTNCVCNCVDCQRNRTIAPNEGVYHAVESLSNAKTVSKSPARETTVGGCNDSTSAVRCLKMLRSALEEFDHRLFIMLERYYALSGCEPCFAKEGGWHAAVPREVLESFSRHLKISAEAFASPLNTSSVQYGSAFRDTDSFFGSVGSFFSLEVVQGAFEINPPFDPTVATQVVEHCTKILSNNANNYPREHKVGSFLLTPFLRFAVLMPTAVSSKRNSIIVNVNSVEGATVRRTDSVTLDVHQDETQHNSQRNLSSAIDFMNAMQSSAFLVAEKLLCGEDTPYRDGCDFVADSTYFLTRMGTYVGILSAGGDGMSKCETIQGLHDVETQLSSPAVSESVEELLDKVGEDWKRLTRRV